MDQTKYYDIVVIGSGPAGAIFCKFIDSKKYRVLLLDGAGRKEKTCGGLLAPSAQRFLAHYNISLPKDIMVSPQSFYVKTIDLDANRAVNYPRNYLNINRKKFDDFLLSMIPKSIDVVKSRCHNIQKLDEGFKLDTDQGTVTCKYVVGADGAQSITRQLLFKHKRIHRYIAIQQWFKAPDIKPFYACIFDSETSPACSWICFKDDLLMFGGAFNSKNCGESFKLQKEKLIKSGYIAKEAFDTPIKTEACQLNYPKLSYGLYQGNDGAFLIGEAGGFVNACSFEGIHFAMSTGEALAKAMNGCDDKKQILRRYKKNSKIIRFKIYKQVFKSPVMYNKYIRKLFMKSGIQQIHVTD